MANCVNKSSKEFKTLAKQINMNPTILAAKVSLWQEINGIDNFPTLKDIVESKEVNFQKNQMVSSEGQIASEETIRDLAERMSDRIGMPFTIISDRTEAYKGKIENGTAYVNLAYATLDTPIHEILGHPIIRAIKENVKEPSMDEHVEVNNYFQDLLKEGKTVEEANKLSNEKFPVKQNILYQNLLKELETGVGKEVLDRIKRDYDYKETESIEKEENEFGFPLNNYVATLIESGLDTETITKLVKEEFPNVDAEFMYHAYIDSQEYYGDEKPTTRTTIKEVYKALGKETAVKNAYSLEEQQEEALVELLGMMTANKLSNTKDGKLISLLKRLLKEMKQYVKSLIKQKEIEIDKLPDNLTIGDLSNILAYSNSKLILPGYKVEYTTPDNMKFDTYEGASNHVSQLSKDIRKIDLNTDSLETENEKIKSLEKQIKDFKYDFTPLNSNRADFYTIQGRLRQNYWARQEDGTTGWTGKSPETLIDPEYDGLVIEVQRGMSKVYEKISQEEAQKIYDDLSDINKATVTSRQAFFALNEQLNTLKKDSITSFIEKNEQYEQSKEIIEQWKKINNIHYNPEEIYSRGQEFSSVVGAYSSFDVNLMMQNLLQHIEDNEKAGGKFAISAYTKPIDKQIGHLEGGGGKIKFKIYPKSEDILWAANTDVYSGSVWDASEKVNKDKKSELLGVSYTKYPSLPNINTVQPNLASIVDDLNHHHNELGIALTGNNFRLEYDDNIPSSTKKVIKAINAILDQRYGEVNSPSNKVIENPGYYLSVNTAYGDSYTIPGFKTYEEALKKRGQELDINGPDRTVDIIKNKGIEPTQTNDTLKESIKDVSGSIQYKSINTMVSTTEFPNNKVGDIVEYKGKQFKILTEQRDADYKGYDYELSPLDKPVYTSQALINTKIAKLKEIAKAQPRSLIRSEVVREGRSYEEEQSWSPEFDLPFQKIPSKTNPVLEIKMSKTDMQKELGITIPARTISNKAIIAIKSRLSSYNNKLLGNNYQIETSKDMTPGSSPLSVAIKVVKYSGNIDLKNKLARAENRVVDASQNQTNISKLKDLNKNTGQQSLFDEVDESINNNVKKHFENKKNQVENNRAKELDVLNEEFQNRKNLTGEELNRLDVVNARYDMQQEVLERTRQARLEDLQEKKEDQQKSNLPEETIDEALNNNPVLTAASIFTPNYDPYLKNKKELLSKVEKALAKLYSISGKNKTASTISNINKLNNLKSSLEEDIDKFEKGTVTPSVIEEFFTKDLDSINTLLDTNDFDNLYLAQDLLDFLNTNLDIVNSNSMFNGIDKDDPLMKAINKITLGKVELERKLSDTYDQVFLNLLDKHYISFSRIGKYKGKSLQEIRETLLDELRNASGFSNEALSIDKNLITKADVIRQLARLELELEQEKEKLLISPAINKINNVLEKGQQELKRLGQFTRVLGKNIYNYSLFIQKDPSGTKNYRLINKFSNAWFDYKQNTDNFYKKKLAQAIDAKERNIALTEHYNELNSNADFVNFTLLHDIFTDPSLDRFKQGDTASASAYRNRLISRIGKENYDDLINEQRTKLQLFLEKRDELIDKKVASLGVNSYNDLSQLEKDKLKITIDTLDPLLFINNHINNNTNKIPVLLGTQTIEFPAKLNYTSVVPKNAEHYNSDFDVIDQNPVLYEMYQAFKEANDVIKDGLLGTGIDLEKGQLINSKRNFREVLMDKSFAELTKNGLGHLLNIKEHLNSLAQFTKDVVSTKTEIDKNSKEIKISGQLTTVERIASRVHRNNVTELKNILDRNLQDSSLIDWVNLSPTLKNKVLDLLDRDNIDDIIKKGSFEVRDLRKYAVSDVISEQSMNLPLMMKANLDLVSEHKARVNSKNTVSVLLNRLNKKTEDNREEKGKGTIKLEHWVKKNIYNQSINNVQWGNITEKIRGEETYNKYNGELRSKYYKNFTKAEKKLFDSYTKRISNIEKQLADPFIDVSIAERLSKEKEGLENSIILMGKDYTLGALTESLLVKLPFLAGLAWNQVAPLKNFLNGMVMVLNRDGQFWKEGNGNIAMNFILGHPIKMVKSKMKLNDHQEEWKKAVLFIESLRVIEDQTSELQRGEEENSKILAAGNFFTDGMYLTKKVEWINQSVSLMARAMDKKIEHPTKKNTDGSPYTIKMFDGQKFEAHEIVEGQLVLKQEWKSPENEANFERMDSPEMLLWKVENKRVNASLNGDYSQEGSVMGKRSTLGRVLSQFKTWVSQFLYDRFAYKQTDLALGIEHSGYYVGPVMNPKTRSAAIATFIGKSALAGIVTANFAGGWAILVPVAGIGYIANQMRKKIRDRNKQSPLPLHSITKKGTWNQFKYVGYNLIPGFGITTANIVTGVLAGKNYLSPIVTDFEKSMQSEEDKANFKNLQLLTKTLQSNMATTMLTMLFMALRGTDKDDDDKNKEQDKWYINAALNLCTNIYSENNFADNPLLMYQSLVEKQGANSLVDNIMKLALYMTHLDNDTLVSGDNAGDSKTMRQAQKMFLPMMVRHIDKIGTEDYLLGYESLLGKYYKQGSPLEDLFDSNLKREKKRRKKDRADVREDIKDRLEEEGYEVTNSKRDKSILNAKATKGYEDIQGIPAINKGNYDKDENLIK